MKISKLEIVNFGKFTDYTLDLEDNFQIIYGNNEDGKSTIMAFIKLMLYSDQGRSRTLEQQTRVLYSPWSGAAMEGAMEFEHAGVNYRLQKQFADTPGRDKVTLINIDKGEEVPLARGEEVGKRFLGLDLAGFKRSSFIKQLGNIKTGQENDDVAERLLTNLVQSGDEDFSQQEVIKRLEKAKYGLVSKSGTIGLLVDYRNKLDSLYNEKEDTAQLIVSQESLQAEYSELKAKLDLEKDLQVKLDALEKLEQKGKLEKLLNNKNELERLKKEITTEAYSFADIPFLLSSSAQLLSEYANKAQAIASINRDDKEFTQITAEENEEYSRIVKDISSYENLLKRYSNNLSPLVAEYNQQKQKLDELNDAISALDEHLAPLVPRRDEIIETQAQIALLEEEINSLKGNLGERQQIWNKELEIHNKEIESYRNQLANIPTKNVPNIPLLILGIITLILSGVGAYFKNIFLAGLVPSVIFLVLAIVLKKNKNESLQQPIQEGLSAADSTLNEFSQSVKEEESLLKAEISKKESTLTAAVRDIAALSDEVSIESIENLESSMVELVDERNELNIKVNALTVTIASHYDQIISELPGEVQELDQADLSDYLKNQISDCSHRLNAIIESKGASSREEFEDKYLESQARQKNIKLVDELETEKNTLKAKFISLISGHTSTADFKDAKVIYEKLSDSYNQANRLENNIELTSAALDANRLSVNDLEILIDKLSVIESDYSNLNKEVIKEELAALKRQNVVSAMENIQKQIRTPNRSLEQIEMEISELEEQAKEAENYYSSVCQALEVMEKSSEEMRQSFGPILNEITGDIFSRLTNDKYSEILVNKNYEIQFKSGVHYRQWEYLSSGTTDQAYLALRLAISKLISDEDGVLPVFLDDVLVQYDDVRAEYALEFLSEYAKENSAQIILFTCHNRIIDFSDNLDISCKKL